MSTAFALAGLGGNNAHGAGFLAAAQEGDLEELEAMLAEDVELHGDGGGLAPAIRHPVFGRERVARMLGNWWSLWRFELPAPLLVGLVVASIGGGISSLGAREFRRAKTTGNPLHPERAS